MVKGALRDPGEITTFLIPLERHNSVIDCASGMLEYCIVSVEFSNAKIRLIN